MRKIKVVFVYVYMGVTTKCDACQFDYCEANDFGLKNVIIIPLPRLDQCDLTESGITLIRMHVNLSFISSVVVHQSGGR